MTAPGLLDEWRRPERDVRIRILSLTELCDVGEQYVSPPRSLRLLLNYVRRLGPLDALRKVRSRLSERGRNRKIAALGAGEVIEAPLDSGLAEGEAVLFFAPSISPDARRAVVDRAFVRAGEPARDQAAEIAPELAPYLAWSSFSGIPLDEPGIARALARLSAPMPAPPHRSGGEDTVQDRHLRPARSSGKLQAAIFGLGNYAKQLILPNIPRGFELARIHEIDPRQLAGWGRNDVSFDTAPWPRDDERYDLWFVAGYHCTHAPIALTALARGGAVAIEKPVATTAAEIQALENAIRVRPEARLFGCFQRRYAIYNDWIREDLGAGPGAPLDYNCIVYEIPLSPLHWYSWPSSGSRLLSNGCHWIDQFMLLNDYADVVSCTVVPGARNGSITFITLGNGAEFTMRLTEVGSPRIGVRDHVEISLGSRTATIRNAQHYHAEDQVRTLRRRSVGVVTAYEAMYREICRRVLAGEPGDSIESLKSSAVTIEADRQYRALTASAGR